VLYGAVVPKSIERCHLQTYMLILGVLPGLTWLLFFYFRGRRRNDRIFGHMLWVFLWACVLTVPAEVFERLANASVDQETLAQSVIASFLLIAPIEEFVKLLAVWVAVYRSPDFREPTDGLLYSTTAAIGFACAENIRFSLHLMGMIGPDVLLLRIFFATPAHIMFASIVGYAMGLARFQRDRELLTVLKGLLGAILLHGIYDTIVAANPEIGPLALIPLMIFMGWLMHRLIRAFRRNYPFPPIGEGALICCPTCGAYTLEKNERCARCGTRVPIMEREAPRFCGRCRARLDPRRDVCPRCGASVATSWSSSRQQDDGTSSDDDPP
jgi:RsiW-degrading membrane proteinase PrsW (M82 family)/rRNA maturation protein Nop10